MKKDLLRRMSKQRRIIFEALKKTKTHPTADTLFKLVRRRLPNISFGTVYRNLNILKEQGKILELTQGKYRCRYDGTMIKHYHFFCLECQKVFDLEELVLRDLDNLDNQVSKKSGFKVKYHLIDFYGACRNCNRLSRNSFQPMITAISNRLQ